MAFEMSFEEAQRAFPELPEKKRLQKLVKVSIGMDTAMSTLSPNQELSREHVRLAMSEAGHGPSTSTVGFYMDKIKEFKRRPVQEFQESVGPDPAAGSQLPSTVQVATDALMLGISSLPAILSRAFATGVAEEAERGRVSSALQRYEFDVRRRELEIDAERLRAEYQKMAAEGIAREEELESLQTQLSDVAAAGAVALEKLSLASREIETGTTMLKSATDQIAAHERQVSNFRDDTKQAHDRADKLEAAGAEAALRHREDLDRRRHEIEEMRRQHAAELAAIRESCEAAIAMERDRNAVLELAICDVLKNVAAPPEVL